MPSQLVKYGLLGLSLVVPFASSPAWPQTDAFMPSGRSSVDTNLSHPTDSGYTPAPQPRRSPQSGSDMSPVLDASMIEALQRQKTNDERNVRERVLQQDAVKSEELRIQGPARKGFFSDPR